MKYILFLLVIVSFAKAQTEECTIPNGKHISSESTATTYLQATEEDRGNPSIITYECFSEYHTKADKHVIAGDTWTAFEIFTTTYSYEDDVSECPTDAFLSGNACVCNNSNLTYDSASNSCKCPDGQTLDSEGICVGGCEPLSSAWLSVNVSETECTVSNLQNLYNQYNTDSKIITGAIFHCDSHCYYTISDGENTDTSEENTTDTSEENTTDTTDENSSTDTTENNTDTNNTDSNTEDNTDNQSNELGYPWEVLGSYIDSELKCLRGDASVYAVIYGFTLPDDATYKWYGDQCYYASESDLNDENTTSNNENTDSNSTSDGNSDDTNSEDKDYTDILNEIKTSITDSDEHIVDSISSLSNDINESSEKNHEDLEKIDTTLNDGFDSLHSDLNDIKEYMKSGESNTEASTTFDQAQNQAQNTISSMTNTLNGIINSYAGTTPIVIGMGTHMFVTPPIYGKTITFDLSSFENLRQYFDIFWILFLAYLNFKIYSMIIRDLLKKL